jgi:hypothetical protein
MRLHLPGQLLCQESLANAARALQRSGCATDRHPLARQNKLAQFAQLILAAHEFFKERRSWKGLLPPGRLRHRSLPSLKVLLIDIPVNISTDRDTMIFGPYFIPL